jgi:hypothetical protein
LWSIVGQEAIGQRGRRRRIRGLRAERGGFMECCNMNLAMFRTLRFIQPVTGDGCTGSVVGLGMAEKLDGNGPIKYPVHWYLLNCDIKWLMVWLPIAMLGMLIRVEIVSSSAQNPTNFDLLSRWFLFSQSWNPSILGHRTGIIHVDFRWIS